MGKKKIKNKMKAKDETKKIKNNKSKKVLEANKNESKRISNNEKEKKEKLLKINTVKYLACAYCDDGIENGFEAYKEN